jgi:hypothetical protein
MLSSESQGPTDDFLATKMGMLSVFLKGSMIMGLGQICSTCLDSHASEDLVRLLECLVKASSKFFETIDLSSLLYDWFRLHEYIGSAVCLTRGQNITTTASSTSNTIVAPLTSVHRVDTFPTPDNMCQSSDDAFLGQLITDFADEAIHDVLLDQSTDTRSGLMKGQ